MYDVMNMETWRHGGSLYPSHKLHVSASMSPCLHVHHIIHYTSHRARAMARWGSRERETPVPKFITSYITQGGSLGVRSRSRQAHRTNALQALTAPHPHSLAGGSHCSSPSPSPAGLPPETGAEPATHMTTRDRLHEKTV